MINILFFIIYIASLALLFSRFNYDHGSHGHKFRLSLPNLYSIVLTMYTVFPLFDCIVSKKHTQYILPFLCKCIILTISLIVGFELSKKIGFRWGEHRKKNYLYEYKLSRTMQYCWTIIFMFLCSFLVAIYIRMYKGGLSYILSSNYKNSFEEGSSIAASLIYSVMPYALVFTDKRIITEKKARIIAFLFSGAVMMIHLLGGNRNLAVMVGLALVWSMYSKKTFGKLQIVIVVICGILLFSSLAVFRQYGLWNVITGRVHMVEGHMSGFLAHLADGELGTTFAFERNAENIPMSVYPYRFGYSYFILPWLNLIPSFILHNRPQTYGVYFKSSLFGLNGVGYGFSPIYEAEINYGCLWWIVFIVIGFILGKINYEGDKENLSSFYNKGIICCIILNFFRIDFAVCFKLIMMMIVFKSIYLLCIKSTMKVRVESRNYGGKYNSICNYVRIQ